MKTQAGTLKIEKDLTKGNLFKQIVIFAIPLILTNVLQKLFNTADIAVLGVFVGDNAVAAVGSTGSLVNLMINFFVGLSTAVNILVSKYLGQQREEDIRKIIGMSVPLSLISGIFLAIICNVFARDILILMNCDKNVLDLAVKYITIYFLGMPVVLLYNFLAAILRASGDSTHPLYYLMVSGILNVVLNVFFVLVLKMDVEGVAIATVVAQAVSAVLCIIQLSKAKGSVKLKFKNMRFYKAEVIKVFRIGLPAGLQGSLFALSNVIIQSTVNKFGDLAMAGSAYASEIDAYIYIIMNSVALSLMSFISQNYGARNIERIRKTIKYAFLIVLALGLFVGLITTFLTGPLLAFITKDEIVIEYAVRKCFIVCPTYFLCGLMEIGSYTLRSLGKSTESMLICLFGSAVFRIIWVNLTYELFKSYELVFISYPISWIITTAILFICVFSMLKKIKHRFENEKAKIEVIHIEKSGAHGS